MVKVAFVKEKKVSSSGVGKLPQLFYRLRPLEMIPLSGIMPGQRQIEFWQIEENFCRNIGNNTSWQRSITYENQEKIMGKEMAGGKDAWVDMGLARHFARKIGKKQVSVCGGQGWTYALQQQMQRENPSSVFTGGFSLSLFVIFDFLLQRSPVWHHKDVAVFDADNPLGRFTALCLAREARLLLLTGKNRPALELLSDEIFQKTGLAVRIVSEEKALQWGKMFFFTGEAKYFSCSGVQWDLAAIAGLRTFSPGSKIESRLLYPAYHKEKYLGAGCSSAVFLAQCEEKVRQEWPDKLSSEKIYFWQQRLAYFQVSPIFLLQKENGQRFYQLFGRENLC